MKKLFVVIGVTFVLLSCNKEAEIKPQLSTSSTSANAYRKAAKTDDQELQTLIRAWAEWVYSRHISVAPFLDPTGDLQLLDQPYSSNVFMLAGGFSPELVERTVTISLSQYQYVFVPLVVITGLYDTCEPTVDPNNPKAFFQGQFKEAFNGPRELTLEWDGASLLSTKQKDARANSGVWTFHVDPSYYENATSCSETSISTAYADGYWAKIPLTLGTHTLKVGGNFDLRRFKFEFSNMVEYTIHVVD